MKALYEEHSSKTYMYYTYIYCNINKLHGDIKKKEAALFKTRLARKPKVNVQLCWISLFSKSSWIKTTASGLSYEHGVNGEKKVIETGVLLIKMDIVLHFTLINSKPGNFNSLREEI